MPQNRSKPARQIKQVKNWHWSLWSNSVSLENEKRTLYVHVGYARNNLLITVSRGAACCNDFLELLKIWLKQHLPHNVGWKIPNSTSRKRTTTTYGFFPSEPSSYANSPLSELRKLFSQCSCSKPTSSISHTRSGLTFQCTNLPPITTHPYYSNPPPLNSDTLTPFHLILSS